MSTHNRHIDEERRKHIHAEVWRRAIEIHDSQLSQNHKISGSGSRFDTCTFDELKAATLVGNGPEGVSRSRLAGFVEEIHGYAPTLDTMTQGAPFAVSLCWAAIRFLIVAGHHAIQLQEDALSNTARILRNIHFWKDGIIYIVSQTQQCELVAFHLAHVINYWLRASRYLERPTRLQRWNIIRKATLHTKLVFAHAQLEKAEDDVHRAMDVVGISTYHQMTDALQTKISSASHLATQQNVCLTMAVAQGMKQGEETRKLVHHGNSMQRITTAQAWLREDRCVQPAYEGTIEDTLQLVTGSKVFKNWVSERKEGILWLTGRPGTGKTQIAALLQRHLAPVPTLRCMVPKAAPLVQNPTSLVVKELLSMILEIAQQLDRDFFEYVLGLIENLMFGAPPVTSSAVASRSACEALLEALETVLARFGPCALIVDSIDNLVDELNPGGEDQATKFLALLGRLSHKEGISVTAVSLHTRWLKTRLPDAYELSISTEDNTAFTVTWVRKQIQQSNRLVLAEASIVQAVESRAHGNWIWATLLLHRLRRASTPEMMKKLLVSAPGLLDEMYAKTHGEIEQSFDQIQRNMRSILLQAIAMSASAFSTDELNDILAVETSDNSCDPDRKLYDSHDVLALCAPFVDIRSERVYFVHSSAKEFVLSRVTTTIEALEYLLDVCLSTLLQQKYLSRGYCEGLLRNNAMPKTESASNVKTQTKEPPLYNHSALNWHRYATQLNDLKEHLRFKIERLLSTNAFISLSENAFVLKGASGFDHHFHVRLLLEPWFERLPTKQKPDFDLAEFFLAPYERLSREFAGEAEEPLLQYLPLIRCAQFLNLAGRSPRDYDRVSNYNGIVARGFLENLGPRDPATLSAQRDDFRRHFWPMEYEEARTGFKYVVDMQKKELDKDDISIVHTQLWLATAHFGLTRVAKAHAELTHVRERYERTYGPSSKITLVASLYEGWTIESQGQLSNAKARYDEIYENWIPTYDLNSPFSSVLTTTLGSLYRKQGRFEEAEELLLRSWGARLVQLTLENPLTFESGLHLALLLREMGRAGEAKPYIAQLEASPIMQASYQRACQLRHIKALINFDEGNYVEGRNDLFQLVMETTGENRQQNNLEALFVRHTLAAAMRDHDEGDEAPMLFTELVRSINGNEPETAGSDRSSGASSSEVTSGSETPVLVDTPSELRAAERAVELVRDSKLDEAAAHLASNGLTWARGEDLWIMMGGPKVDTNAARYHPSK